MTNACPPPCEGAGCVILLAMVLSSLGKRSRGRSERVRRIVTPEGDPTVEAGETPSGGLGAELDRIEVGGRRGRHRPPPARLLAGGRPDQARRRADRAVRGAGGPDRREGVPGAGPVPACRSGWGTRCCWSRWPSAVGRGRARRAERRRRTRSASTWSRGPASRCSWRRGAWAVGLHSPTHWLVGRLVGIRFTDYFLGRSRRRPCPG